MGACAAAGAAGAAMRWLAAVLLAALAGAAPGYWRGRADGRLAERARHDAQLVQQLSAVLEQHGSLVQQSQEASQRLRRAAAARARADDETTRELADALAKTADLRAACVLDAGVLRQVDAARAAAAAAAAGGFAGAVPAAAAQRGR